MNLPRLISQTPLINLDWRQACHQTLMCLLAVGLLMLATCPLGLAVEASGPLDGAELFRIHCVGCHPKGGNIIRRGKTLQQRALKRDGLDSSAAIADLVAKGKNNMSAFRDRLSDQQISAVSTYVLNQAEQGWD